MPISTIPKQAHAGLKLILTVDNPTFEAIVHSLSILEPTAYLKTVDQKIQAEAQLSKETTREVVRALLTAYRLLAELKMPLPEFALEITEVMKRDGIVGNVSSETIQNRMLRVLNFEKSFGVTAKSQDVLTDFEHTVCSIRILTDMRPVFPEPMGAPSGTAIIHNLKIAYHEAGVIKEFFVAMDGDDLKRLRTLLERAEQKAEILKHAIRDAHLNYLEG